jgi:plastocyanin
VKGARALASGMLVLAAICAVPAVSAAQDVGTTTTTPATTTTGTTPTTPAPATPPADPVTTTTSTTSAPPAPTVSGPTRRAHAAASASVTMGDFFFSAATVTIAVGDTVTWHNSGQAPHTATANNGSFDTGTVNSGGSASYRFSSAGTFAYICTIHPNMKGTVRVLSSNNGGGGGGGGSSSSSSGTSESSAVASPAAAGDSNTLPMTGMAVGALTVAGLALLASGLLVRRAGDSKRSRLSIF